MDKVAILVIGSGAPKILGRVLDLFQDARFRIFLHVDAKTDLAGYARDVRDIERVTLIEPRIAVFWGGWGMIEAELSLIRTALSDPSISNLILVSDDAVPVRSPDAIYKSLIASPDRLGFSPTNFARHCYQRMFFVDSKFTSVRNMPAVHRDISPADLEMMQRILQLSERGKKYLPEVYFGRQWWALSRKTASEIVRCVEQDEHLAESFRFSLFSDEIFFPTVYRLCFPDAPLPDVPMFAAFGKDQPPRRYAKKEELDDVVLSDHHLFLRKIIFDNPDLVDVVAEWWEKTV